MGATFPWKVSRKRVVSSRSRYQSIRLTEQELHSHDRLGPPAISRFSLFREGEFMGVTRILIVEDEPNMVAGLRDNFEYEGFQVATALDGVDGLERALEDSPDLVILDVMMPRMSGLDVCKQLKAKRPSIPIIMLTARGQEVDKVVGLELGADDYVTKPFSIRELLARVKAVLRRTQTLPKEMDRYAFGDVEVDLRSYQVLRGGNPVELSGKEFELLKHFLCHSGQTLSRDRLLDEVWGYENYPTTRTVDTHIVRIRQKLEPVPEEPRYFLTVHGIGYKFVG
jgi:two-component system alkaline phosphatase synthesis response regulator PhoP